MAPTTAAEEQRKGVWSGEIPDPIDWFHGPMTKPDRLPWVPGPMTRLYHDNANYMYGIEKPQISSSSIPKTNGGYKGRLGENWTFSDENTLDYGGITWKAGSDPSCLLLPGLLHESESYWMAIAMQVYNSSKYWMCVKVQHLEFLERVLSDPSHPRYEYYHILNAQFRQMPQEYVNILTPNATHKARREKERAMVLCNLWQTLCIPRQFVNHLMMQVTADLYSIYLITFLHTNTEEDYDGHTPDFFARGNYSNRHCAIRLNCNLIYEPLFALVANPSTVRLPRITFDNSHTSGGKVGVDGKQDDSYHPWLCDFLDFPVLEPLYPEIVVADCDDEHLQKVLWVTLTEEKSRRLTRLSTRVYLRGGTVEMTAVEEDSSEDTEEYLMWSSTGFNKESPKDTKESLIRTGSHFKKDNTEDAEDSRIWTGTRFKDEGEPDSDDDIKGLDDTPKPKPNRIVRQPIPTVDGRVRQREVFVPLKRDPCPKYEKMSADTIRWAANMYNVYVPACRSTYEELDKIVVPALKQAFLADEDRLEREHRDAWEREQEILDECWEIDQGLLIPKKF